MFRCSLGFLFFFLFYIFLFAHTNNYNTLHLQFITGNCYRLQKKEINKKKRKDKVHQNITTVYILTIKKKGCLPYGLPSPIRPFVACTLINCIGQILFYSEGHCLKVAHFLLKEAKLLLSNAICFSISMERMTN